MSDVMTTGTSEIVESYRAIQVAAVERYAALDREMRELEQAFPTLRQKPTQTSRRQAAQSSRRTAEWTSERVAAQSAAMKAAWARRRASETPEPEAAYAAV